MGFAALDHGDFRAVRVQLLRDVMTTGAGPEHQRLAVSPLLGVLEIARVHLGAGKLIEAR
jgi:hypothetical protein